MILLFLFTVNQWAFYNPQLCIPSPIVYNSILTLSPSFDVGKWRSQRSHIQLFMNPNPKSSINRKILRNYKEKQQIARPNRDQSTEQKPLILLKITQKQKEKRSKIAYKAHFLYIQFLTTPNQTLNLKISNTCKSPKQTRKKTQNEQSLQMSNT